MVKRSLEEIAEIFTGARLDRAKNNRHKRKQSVLKNKFLESTSKFDYEEISISVEFMFSKFYSQTGDIIISLSEPNNLMLVEGENYIVPMFFAIIRLKEGYDPKFIYNALTNAYFSKELHKKVEGTSLKILKIDYLKKIELNIPDYEEQKKYVDFIELIDERNEVLENNLKLNNEFKEKILYDLLNDKEGDMYGR